MQHPHGCLKSRCLNRNGGVDRAAVHANAAKTLGYAQAVLDDGYRPGVVTIDDNWSEDYEVWKFRRDRFPDPKATVDELHERGFSMMLWV
jgi:hypothetical protein